MSVSIAARYPSRLAGTVVLIAIALLPLGVAASALFAPPADGPVAAMFPPWWGAQRAFVAAAAAGRVIRFGGVPFIVVVATGDRPRLRAAGAWLLLDPAAFGACTLASALHQQKRVS